MRLEEVEDVLINKAGLLEIDAEALRQAVKVLRGLRKQAESESD